MAQSTQLELFGRRKARFALPEDYTPVAAPHFDVARIVLTRGSLATAEREAFVRRICAVYPGVPVEEQLDVSHNRVVLGEADAVLRLELGKKTLVFGELGIKSAVWDNGYRGGMYPYERFFSAYDFCPYGCAYCYLNATPSAAFSPAVKVYVNLPEIVSEIERLADAIGRPSGFYLGKMQDGLALEPLSGYAAVLITRFAGPGPVRQVIQTKSANVNTLLGLEHGGHTALAWTLSPEPIAAAYERNAPSPSERLTAMEKCVAAGYPVCANIAPLMLEGHWEDLYFDLVRRLLDQVPVRRIYFGGVYLKRLSLSYFKQRAGKDAHAMQQGDWRRVQGGGAVSYRAGYADALYQRIAEYVKARHRCEFDMGGINGGSLVVRFLREGSFRVFPDCPEAGHGLPAT